MGVIKKQSVNSAIITYIGFFIGAINYLFVMPWAFSSEQIGLLQVFTQFAIQVVTFGGLGMTVAVNKFIPYYKRHLLPQKNDLFTIVLITGTLGMLLTLFVLYQSNDLIVQKVNTQSPLFVEYMYLFPIFALGYFYSYTFDNLNINYHFNPWSSFVREIFYRFFNVIAAVIFVAGVLDFSGVINFYMSIYWIGAGLLLFQLLKNKIFYFPVKISSLTKRIRKNMIYYSVSSWGLNIFGTALQSIELLGITGLAGLGHAAVYSVAKFLISPIITPYGSLVSASTPVISEAWRNRDMQKIEEVYKKTAITMLSLGGFLFLLLAINAYDIFYLIPSKFFGSNESLIDQAFWVVIILGTARMLDFSTSVNSIILQNSRSYFRIDLYINAITIALSIPLNYFLIKHIGIAGAAISYLIISFCVNSFKSIYLFYKEKIHPFSSKWIYLLGLFLLSIFLVFAINFILDRYFIVDSTNRMHVMAVIVVKSLLICVFFIPSYYKLNISEDLNSLIVKLPQFLKIRK